MKKTILLQGRAIEYDLQRKRVKNINIRVKSDLTVRVSASSRVSQDQIENILREKADFILSALSKYEARQKSAPKASKDVYGNDTVMLFGEILPITVVVGKKKKAEARENDLLVTLKDVNDGEARRKAISAALDAILARTVEELCQEIYPDFEDYLPHFPEIKYRHMKSRWGSCNYKKYILTFNYHLVHAPIDCIEYVVYHEFTHFIHPDHSKAFYAEVSRYVPDYKEKKNKLQSVIIDQT